MIQFYNKLAPPTKLVLQGLLSILIGALSAGVTAAYQSYSAHGLLQPTILLNIFLATFLPLFMAQLYAYVPTHLTQEAQAGNDLLRLALETLKSTSVPIAQPIVQATPQPLQPINITYNHPGAVEASYNQEVQVKEVEKPQSNPLLNRPSNPALDITYNKTTVQDEGLPENPAPVPSVMPPHLAALNLITASPMTASIAPLAQVPFTPLNEDTLTAIQIARLKAVAGK